MRCRTYLTVALTACSHFVPTVLTARTAKRWLPAARLRVVLRVVLLVSVYFFTPSIQTCTLLSLPVMVEAAWIATGEDTVAPLAG